MSAGFSHAQDFAAPGSSWVYSDHELTGNHSYPRGIVSVGDTVVNGQPVHIVIGDCFCGGGVANYIYELNRRVYFYNYQSGTFNLLYDFNLNAGESFMLYPQDAAEDSFYVVVDSTGLDTINGFLLKTQFVHVQAFPPHIAYEFHGKIIEGIGSTDCLYPQFGSCDPPTNGLRCYQDPVIGFYDTRLAPSCDTVYVISDGVDEPGYDVHATLSPNPFSENAVLSVRHPGTAGGTIDITDITGRIMREENFSGSNISIQRENLEEGVYFYYLRMGNASASGKFIID